MVKYNGNAMKNAVNSQEKRKVHLVGGGIASLASAVFFIRDGHFPGENIHIYEELEVTGGSMDGCGNPEEGYVLRGGRMFDEEAYVCTFDLLESIPSLTDPKRTVRDEFNAFNKKMISGSKARLVDKNKKIVDVSTLGFCRQDRLALLDLMAKPEASFGTKTVKECFPESFFKTDFWFMWATTFAFQPWHSAVEFKRYLHRFVHEFPRINDLSGVRRTPYNQYDSIILPITEWLKSQGVHFEMGCSVTNMGFKSSKAEKTVQEISLIRRGKEEKIQINDSDFVFTTIGSMTAGHSLGSMTKAPEIRSKEGVWAWKLWENIAKDRPEFGKPTVFNERVKESLWESFTVTLKDPGFFDKMKAFTGNEHGTGGLVTFKDSNWFMSIVLAYQPHFINQPDDVQVFWGYSLSPEKEGNYVKKKMSQCTGEEILRELCGHLGFEDIMPSMIQNANCIPCMMPFITSQFLTRSQGDRPPVIPQGSTNLAFLGQFCEIPDDVVFTVDYSVRSAQTAVYSMLKLDKEVTPIYKGQYDARVLMNSALVMMKDEDLRTSLNSILSIIR